MKTKKWLSSLLIATTCFSTAGVLVGCGSDKDDKKEPTANKDENQFLKLILIEPQTLDPNEANDMDTFTALAAVQEGLFRAQRTEDGQEKIVNAASKEHTVSDDGLVWTFKLRDMKWSDGKEVTAQHFVDSFIRLLDKDKAFPYAYFAYDIKNAKDYNLGKAKAEDVAVKAKDDKTLEITLANPTPHFQKKLIMASFYPIRLDAIEKGGSTWNSDISKQVYCGPYTIKEWTKENSITFEKNPNYWDKENVFINTVYMNAMPEFSTQAQLFETQQLDVTGSRQEYVEKWTKSAEEGKWKFLKENTPASDYFGFNMKTGGPSGIMKNQKIRKAMALAFDREEFLNVLYARYTPSTGLIPNAITSNGKEFRKEVPEPLKADYDKYKNNKDKLQELFKEGLKELGKDTNNLKDIKIKYITSGKNAFATQLQEWLKQQFEKNLGITFEIEILGDSKLYSQAKKELKFDMIWLGWVGDFNDPLTFLEIWESTGGNNFSGFSNKEYDDVLAKLNGEIDESKRFEHYKKLESILVKEEVAISPIMYGDNRRFVQNYVKNMQYPLFGPTYEWRWAYTEGRP